MNTPGVHSTYGMANRLNIIILCAFTCIVMSSCIAPSAPRENLSVHRTASPPPVSRDDEPARKAAAEELGPEIAEALPQREEQPPTPVDPGAERIVLSIERAVDTAVGVPQSGMRIGTTELRNRSRCQRHEFDTLRERLTKQLTAAGRAYDITFVEAADGEVDFELHGSAYLITADGFDQWELFLTLNPADQSWVIWESPGPVRMLRQPRPGQAHVLLLW